MIWESFLIAAAALKKSGSVWVSPTEDPPPEGRVTQGTHTEHTQTQNTYEKWLERPRHRPHLFWMEEGGFKLEKSVLIDIPPAVGTQRDTYMTKPALRPQLTPTPLIGRRCPE